MTKPTFVYLAQSKRYLNLANVTLIVDDANGTAALLTSAEQDSMVSLDAHDRQTIRAALRQLTINAHEVKS